MVNPERRLDHDDHPGSLPSSGGLTPSVFVPNGVAANPWCQRDGGANGKDHFLVPLSRIKIFRRMQPVFFFLKTCSSTVALRLFRKCVAGLLLTSLECSFWWFNVVLECPGVERRSSAGKVIGVKLGELTRRIRIDGPFESIKESIKTAFGLRTKRPFWLEDEEGVVQTLSRDMPPGQYSLILDPGIEHPLLCMDTYWSTTSSGEVSNERIFLR